MIRGLKTRAPDVRFWEKVSVGDVDECWTWNGAKTPSGHGVFKFSKKTNYLAHRYVMLRVFGALGLSDIVCHKCNNPSCCNPNHLYIGTREENNKHRSVSIKHSSIKSGLTGIYWDKRRNNWKAAGSRNNKYVFLYQGPSLNKAIQAREEWEKQIKSEIKEILL